MEKLLPKMSKLLLQLFVFLLLFNAVVESASLTCNSETRRANTFDTTITQKETICENVPRSFLIDTIYFAPEKYPQDLIIKNSEIPTISNYTSLLNMQDIRRLVLRNLSVEYIMPGAFRQMRALEELDLSNNKLTKIAAGTFEGLTSLKSLYLNNNKIGDVSEDAFQSVPDLETLDFSGNPIKSLSGVRFVKSVEVRTSHNEYYVNL